jgi:hypothetical protein
MIINQVTRLLVVLGVINHRIIKNSLMWKYLNHLKNFYATFE